MREEHKLKKAIQQDGVDTQSDILDELKRRYPQYVEQSDNQKAPVRKKRAAVVFALAVVAACLAIVVPCAVLLPNHNNDNNGENNDIRYCDIDEYKILDDVEYTIGEYRENNNRNFLYFDWYEIGEDRSTGCYISNLDDEVLGLKENMYLPESDEFVQLSITKANVYLSVLDSSIKDCDKDYIVDNHTVKWVVNKEAALCVFEDNGYRYFVRIKQGQDENRLFELVAKLLETN